MSRRLLVTPVVAALLLAGCGGAHAPKTPSLKAGTPGSPGTGGGLTVTATDARLGDATTATAAGVRELPVHRVVDAQALRRQVNRRRQGVGAGASCANADLMPDTTNLATVVEATLCLLNGERADVGLPALTSNERLAQAAGEHSQDMVNNQYFDHMAPDGRDVVDRIRSTGYIPSDRRWTVGENLAWGTGDLATPRNIVTAWMNSQGHRENILRPEFREIGFGVVIGNPRSTDGQGATFTTNFGAISGDSAASATQASTQAVAVAARPSSTKRHALRRSSALRRYRLARRHAIAVRARIARQAKRAHARR